jgi:hypothetical protein
MNTTGSWNQAAENVTLLGLPGREMQDCFSGASAMA